MSHCVCLCFGASNLRPSSAALKGRVYKADEDPGSHITTVPPLHTERTTSTMLQELLLVLPLLAQGAFKGNDGCNLPAPSKEKFFMTTEEKPWYQQYQYEVPGLFDLGCTMYVQSPGKSATEMYLTGNFSKAPGFPLDSYVSVTGNKLDKVYEGVWKSILSGPYNVVYSHEDFIMDHYCFLGHEVAQIFTTVKEPSNELMEKIWEVVDSHPEVDRSKFKKVVC